MAKNSLFDQLFNQVISEQSGLGADMGGGAPDMGGAPSMEDDAAELGVDTEGGEGDEGGDDTVTLTLSKGLAQELMEVLKGVVGEGEGEEEGGEEEMGGEEGGEEGGEGEGEEQGGAMGESPAVETMEELPVDKYVKAMQSRNQRVQGSATNATNAHGNASGEVTKPHGLQKMNMSYDDGKSMKAKTTEYGVSGKGKNILNR
jgi:hypothetical protein